MAQEYIEKQNSSVLKKTTSLTSNGNINKIKYYNPDASNSDSDGWSNCTMKYWNGTEWINVIPNKWNGSSWE